jgi:hypothetical protein
MHERVNKKIGMWACPRSRSTVITRAFEQLDGCIVYDEPFIGPHRTIRSEQFQWSETTDVSQNEMESDHRKVIEKLTGDLPEGKKFSFQKLSTDSYLPEFGMNWIPKLTNFILIHHPNDILISLRKALVRQKFHGTDIDDELVGIKMLHQIFTELKSKAGETPIVISSDDVVKNPKLTLQWLCITLGLPFDEKMLTWEKGLKNSVLYTSSMLTEADTEPWYQQIRDSVGFLPYKKREEHLPDDLKPMLEKSMPYYEELFQHRHVFPELG